MDAHNINSRKGIIHLAIVVMIVRVVNCMIFRAHDRFGVSPLIKVKIYVRQKNTLAME